ncbi:ABC transporter permease [Actinomadura atramentaria]|uniref:ABC transporter permease n=1 Tax=Actinomadura atramentaria TaxID=1990 RepID=UPI00036D476D|nr:ABC transporter permease [Actinomadura atramentaria]
MDDRLRTLPMAAGAPLVGRLAAEAVRGAVTVAVVVAAGLALGFRFDTGPLEIAGFLVLPVAFGAALGCVMIAVAVRAVAAETSASALNALLVALSFFSTGFVPRESLADRVRPVAAVNPLSSVIEAMRALAHGGALAGPLTRSLAWTIGLATVFGYLAARGYRRRNLR